MTKDELIREISYCSSFHAFCYDGSTINIIAENLEGCVGHPENFMNFPDDVEHLDDISVNWEALKTAKNRSLGNVYAILNLVNDYVNTPVEQRSSFDETRKNIQAITACHVDESAGAILPQRGVIITLDDGRELQGKRPYDDICISDFEEAAIDFGNFIIPTAHIQSIRKCGDDNE